MKAISRIHHSSQSQTEQRESKSHEKFIICQLSHLVNNEKFDKRRKFSGGPVFNLPCIYFLQDFHRKICTSQTDKNTLLWGSSIMFVTSANLLAVIQALENVAQH